MNRSVCCQKRTSSGSLSVRDRERLRQKMQAKTSVGHRTDRATSGIVLTLVSMGADTIKNAHSIPAELAEGKH